jgi:hypothetical protein
LLCGVGMENNINTQNIISALSMFVSGADFINKPAVNWVCCPICQTKKISIDGVPLTNYPIVDEERVLQLEIPIACKNNHKGRLIFLGMNSEKDSFISYTFYKEVATSYHEYLKSNEWKQKAEQAKEQAGWRCQLCNKEGNKGSLHAHHRTYERIGNELPEDITVLCSTCHAKFHNKPERS